MNLDQLHKNLKGLFKDGTKVKMSIERNASKPTIIFTVIPKSADLRPEVLNSTVLNFIQEIKPPVTYGRTKYSGVSIFYGIKSGMHFAHDDTFNFNKFIAQHKLNHIDIHLIAELPSCSPKI